MIAGSWANFDTSAVKPTRRIDTWNEQGSVALCGMSVEPLDRQIFSAQLSRIDFGPLSMISVRSTAARAVGLGARWGRPFEDCFLVSLPVRGRCVFEQNETICEVNPGDMIIRDIAKPWVQTCAEGMEIIIIRIPYAELCSRIDDPTRLEGKVLSTAFPHVAIAADIIRGAHRALSREAAGGWQFTVADIIMNGLRLLYEGTVDTGTVLPTTRKSVCIKREAMTYMLRHLEDPNLTIAQVAEALSVSSRRLQRAFVDAGETPIQFLLSHRLERAAHELLNRKGPNRASILDIAMSVGFNDASHFSWAFTRRFGLSPRKYRDAKLN